MGDDLNVYGDKHFTVGNSASTRTGLVWSFIFFYEDLSWPEGYQEQMWSVVMGNTTEGVCDNRGLGTLLWTTAH